MILEELRSELVKLIPLIRKYRDIKKVEDLTDEKKTEFEANVARAKVVESEISDLETAIELESRFNQTANFPIPSYTGGDGDGDNGDKEGRAQVEDQPIYRGRFALGAQTQDMITVLRGRSGATEAKSRLDQAEKRESETRAAGTGMVESVAVDGGMLLQGESVIDLMTNGWNNNAVLSRTDALTIGGSFYDQIELDDSDSRATGSRGGGIRWYSDSELAEITSSKTKFRKNRYEPERLTGLYYMSNELDQDVPALQGEMEKLFGDELTFRKQSLVIDGTGVGEALGFRTSDAMVQVAKESGQTAKTIVYENLIKMIARVKLQNLSNLVWLINQDCLPQLYTLTIAVGTGGSVVSAFLPNLSGAPGVLGTLLGFPVIPIEQCQTLGTAGDIMLVDLAGYRSVNKGGVQSAVSMHVMFVYNQLTVRYIVRFSGQPRIKAPLTPYKGSDTVSYFIKLATRA